METGASVPWLASYQVLTDRWGIVDLSSRSRVELTGADRVQFLNGFCTNDIKLLGPGQGCEAFLTNHQGRIAGHVYVRMLSDSLVLDSAPGQAAAIIQHLDRFVISDRVEFRDLSDLTGELLLAGKESPALLGTVCGEPPPEGLWSHAARTFSGISVSVQRVPYASEASFFLTTPKESLAVVEKALLAAGGSLGEPAAVEAARIEAGVPLYGRDITLDNLPQEIGRNAQAISFTKGCYLGQETVARIDALGHVNRLLVGVRFSGDEGPAPGLELVFGDKTVGQVTSACWSPRLKAPLAFALLRRQQAAPGTCLSSPLGPAEVVSLPLG